MEKKLNCIIIEDELPAVHLVEKYIADTPGLELITSFRKPSEALSFLKEHTADIVFCDIQMPGMTGIELMKASGTKSLVIFTTAYSEFAAEAYDLDAIDYLKKPFSFERFSRAVDKAREITGVRNSNNTIHEHRDEFITIRTGNKLVRIAYSDILFLEAFHEYVKIITAENKFITFERLKNMEALLPDAKFMRVHRSYIVHREKVRSMTGNLLEIDRYQVPVSREMKNTVLKTLF